MPGERVREWAARRDAALRNKDPMQYCPPGNEERSR